MIIMYLQGGLGNQMFQYALGKCLALKHNTTLKLYVGFLSQKPKNPHYTLRDYELNLLNIEENFASEEEVIHLFNAKPRLSVRLLYRLLHKPIPYFKRPSIKELSTSFDENIFNINNNSILVGYWQSEKYFKEIENIIRSEFTSKNRMSESGLTILKLIQSCNSIGVHFRRGDYVKDSETNKYHGVCSEQFYLDAFSYIVKQVEQPVFFMFSDDIEWVKENVRFNFQFYYVENTLKNKQEDLWLMSACKHNIIANSSYSWWAAWLNSNPNKIVIAPAKWVAKEGVDTNDFLPEKWIKF